MASEKVKIQVNAKPYRWLKQSRARFNFMFGGASSTKSWTIAQYLIIEKFCREPGIGIMCIRKTRPAVRVSCYRLIKYWLDKLNIPHSENRTEMTITGANGSKIYADGLDDPEKKKSIEGINYIWIEETTELSKHDFMQLNIRCRATNPHGINQIFCSFNPTDPVGNEWLKNLVEKPDANSRVMKLTHLDNPFLSDEEAQQIENLADQDYEYDMIYRQGLWATPTFIIYTNWDVVNEFPDECENIGYGLDFGFNNPTALLRIGSRDTEDVFIDELIYETKLTNNDLIDRLKMLIRNPDQIIVADCAEPDRIQEIANAGFNIYPCIKGQGSVAVGIDRCKRYKLHVTTRSENTITEFRGYKNKVDKSGNVLDSPVEFRDHAMDAMRYYIGNMTDQESELIEVGEYAIN